MKIQVSHSPDRGDWFVLKPLPWKPTAAVDGTPITNRMTLESFLARGHLVYELDVIPPEHCHDDDGTVEGCPGCFWEPSIRLISQEVANQDLRGGFPVITDTEARNTMRRRHP